ncbi:hypothetical protein BZA05DRAFT_448558 [Tricharina praecox]|uniref:uncharacterized protein n=1 Tax=Tricharina praecox TaxID=43433 RepID=UPI002220775E|nr:uncharacterized protein BZA05DRAFT_448558 [Tricharina praecox]KAI5844205.1 hypothetical protein BZA05DRAFT_448558 [Tricharina praecox]
MSYEYAMDINITPSLANQSFSASDLNLPLSSKYLSRQPSMQNLRAAAADQSPLYSSRHPMASERYFSFTAFEDVEPFAEVKPVQLGFKPVRPVKPYREVESYPDIEDIGEDGPPPAEPIRAEPSAPSVRLGTGTGNFLCLTPEVSHPYNGNAEQSKLSTHQRTDNLASRGGVDPRLAAYRELKPYLGSGYDSLDFRKEFSLRPKDQGLRRDEFIDECVRRGVSDLAKQELYMLDAALEDQKAEMVWEKQVDDTWKKMVEYIATAEKEREMKKSVVQEYVEQVEEEVEVYYEQVEEEAMEEEVMMVDEESTFSVDDVVVSGAQTEESTVRFSSSSMLSDHTPMSLDGRQYRSPYSSAKDEPVKKRRWYEVWKSKRSRRTTTS